MSQLGEGLVEAGQQSLGLFGHALEAGGGVVDRSPAKRAESIRVYNRGILLFVQNMGMPLLYHGSHILVKGNVAKNGATIPLRAYSMRTLKKGGRKRCDVRIGEITILQICSAVNK